MKKSLLFSFGILVNLACSIPSIAADKLAFRVGVFGKEMAPDYEFNNQVLDLVRQALIGEASVEGKVFKYLNVLSKLIVEGRGDEGGQSICMETHPMMHNKFQDTIKKFELLKDKVPSNTNYSIEELNRCRSRSESDGHF